MSGECAIEPENPTSLPRWKIGAAMVMSGRCPVASQGSLVMTQSPGCHCSMGMRSRKLRNVRGRMPTNEGMPAVFSASESPLASINTVAKSFDSRTMVENEVRSNAAADSSAIEIRRFQKISSVIGSNAGIAESFIDNRWADGS